MAYKPRIETNNFDLTSILATINELPEASKGVSLDVITASSLPATVVDNQIVVITDTTPSTIYVDTDEPANPVNGDVWVQVGESANGIAFSETFRNGLISVKQYNGSAWNVLPGYIGLSGVWQQFAQSILPIGTPLEQWTWEQIVYLANSGEDVTQYFAAGDQKNLVLTTGEVVPVVIGDFNRNTITNSGGKKASIAFTFKICLKTTHAMNDSPITADGWDGSKMRNTHMVDIFNTFPAELRADGAVKYVDVMASAGNRSTAITTSSDRLRLHSIVELGLSSVYAVPGEGTQYAYYTSGNRIKTVDGVTSPYWTRSASTGYGDSFCYVDTSGKALGTGTASDSIGVACGFDI